MVSLRYLNRILIILFTLPVVSYANQDFSKFTESSNQNGCYVDVNLNCRDKKENGKFFYEKIQWLTKTSAARRELYSSNEVQQNFNSCYYFAQLIKTECGISDPVQLIYKSATLTNAIESFIMSPNENLSKVSSLPKIFQDYFNDLLKNVPNYYPSKLTFGSEINGFKMNEFGQIVNPKFGNLFIGKLNIKSQCNTINGKTKCVDEPVKDGNFEAIFDEGIFQIKSQKYGTSFAVDASSFTNAKLEYLNAPPYMQIVGDEGIAWAAVNQFAQFKLITGQKLHLTSNIVFKDIFLMMQGDGNLVLRELLTGRILWQTGPNIWCKEKLNNCNDFLEYQAIFDGKQLTLNYVNKNNKKTTYWLAGDKKGDKNLNFTSTYPYIQIIDKDNLINWPRADWLSCASIESNKVTCLHPEMPLYNQGNQGLLNYVNAKEGTNLQREPGWCVPTTTSMFGKTYANEKKRYYDLDKGQLTELTHSFFDGQDPSNIIWNMIKKLQMDVSVPSYKLLNNEFKGAGYPFALSSLLEISKVHNIFPFIKQENKNFGGYGFIRIPYERASYTFPNASENTLGASMKTQERERLFIEKMPYGIITVQNNYSHVMAVNGIENSKFLKIYDPWGSIYDAEVSSDFNGIKYAKSVNEFGQGSLAYFGGSVDQNFFVYSITSDRPIKHQPTYGMNSSATLNSSMAIDVLDGDVSLSSANSSGEVNGYIQVDGLLPDYKQMKIVEITGQPCAQNCEISYNNGINVVLDVIAKGTNLKYQWFFKALQNSRFYPLKDGNIQTLKFKMDQNYVGEYYVQVCNELGCVGSRSVNLKMSGQPIFRKDLYCNIPGGCDKNFEYSLGNGFGLSYEVINAKSCVWFKDGVSSHDDPANRVCGFARLFDSATSCKDQVLNYGKAIGNKIWSFGKDGSIGFFIAPETTGVYQVLCQNEYGSTWSRAIEVNGKFSPSGNVVLNPTNRFENKYRTGELISLKANYDGSGLLEYQWYKDNIKINGATGSLYSFKMDNKSVGNYRVEVWNKYGKTKDYFPISIKLDETNGLIINPNKWAFNLGESVTIQFSSMNTKKRTYEWYLNSVKLPGADTDKITVQVNLSNIGYYSVVYNEEGSTTNTAPVLISITGQVPVIIENVHDWFVRVGSPLFISGSAVSAEKVNYKWYKNNIPIEGPIGTSPHLSFQIVKKDDLGKYYFTVENEFGTTKSKEFNIFEIVEMPKAPTITAQPQPVGKKSGESVSLSVTATGTGTLSYQWYKGSTAINGAKSATYTFTMASDKEGEYKVKVSNSAGDITSNIAKVEMPKAPTITAQPQPVGKKSGESVSLSVTATGTGTLSYQWYKGSTAINGAKSATYTFTMASDKEGEYKVKVSNSAGDITSNIAKVEMPKAPTITAQPQPVGKKSGESVSLSVTATGTGTLSYQWYKGSTAINGAKSATYTFTMASDKEGEYKVKVSNSAGDITSNIAKVEMPKAPTITAQPQPVGKKSGESVSLSVTATGTGTLSYQWYKGSTAINGAKSATYTFTMASDKEGEYKVKVSNSAGDITSNIAKVEMPKAPTITAQPQPVGKKSGESVSLSVTATGTGTLSYQWYKGSTAINGAKSATYTFTMASDKEGEYKVKVSNSAGDITSNIAKVEMPKAPTITAQPQPVGKKSGESVSLSVTATGTGTLSYQWYKGSTAINGAKSATYTFTMASDKEGEYKVKVSNSAGDITSNIAKVEMPKAPTITAQPQPVGKKSGESVSLSVTATGTGTLSYQWYKGSTAINGAKSATYTFTMASDKEGEYKVKVSNSAGDITSNIAKVEMPKAPTITAQPQPVGKKSGESVSLSVTATGTGTLSYQWYKGSTAINGAKSATYTFTMASDKEGEYKVKVSNSAGDITSNIAKVEMPKAPTITAQPQPVGKKSGESVSLSVTATGTGTLSYQWYKGSTAINGAKSATYTFTMASDKEGEYKVKVSNSAGDITSNIAKVEMPKAPTITAQPQPVGKKSGESVSLSVTATGTGTLSYQWYKGSTAINGAKSATYTFTMASDKEGEYKVKITNTIGEVTSTTAKVKELHPPIITNQPSSQELKIGEYATLRVQATSKIQLSYQWFKDGKLLTNEVANYLAFEMKNSSTGQYWVIVRTDDGQVESVKVEVKLNGRPNIKFNNQAISEREGGTISLNVTAGGIEPLNYIWYHKNVELKNSNSATYSFKMSESTEGLYKVKVSNSYGSITSDEISINMNRTPKITIGLEGASAIAKQKVTLSVTAIGGQPLSYEWYLDGKRIPDANSAKYEFIAAKSFAGRYQVKVVNAYGSELSDTRTVTITDEPLNIIRGPVGGVKSNGEKVSLSVEVNGGKSSSTLSYTWYLNNNPIRGENSSTYNFTMSNSAAGTYKVCVRKDGVDKCVEAVISIYSSPVRGR